MSAGPTTATAGAALALLVDGAARTVQLDAVAVAGYTGRDQAAVRHHIDELAAIGVAPPPSVPMYWWQPAWTATQADEVVVASPDTSGEVEVVLVVDGDDVFVALGSDHTDRAAEALDIAISKQLCPTPIGRDAWPLERVADRLDELELRSWVAPLDGGPEQLYQDGTLADLVPATDLLVGLAPPRPARFALLTGTLSAKGGVRPSAGFRAELRDPVTGDALTLAYRTRTLDDVRAGR